MDPTPAELPPGCLVLLIRLSDGMAADVPTTRGDIPAFVAARQLADELLDGLVNAAAQHALGPFEVAVLGYRTAADGAPHLISLFPSSDKTPRFVPLAQVANMPAETRAGEGQPKKWAVLPPCEGDPGSAAALARVYQMVAVWLTGRYFARPPVVVHCTTAEGLDSAYARVARSLGLLTTGYGSVRLMHYVFVPGSDPVPVGAWAGAPDAEPWAELFELSCELPEMADAGKPTRRALAVNDWDITDQWSAIFDATWRDDPTAGDGAGGFAASREMWAQKMGNSPEQWEDAFAVDPAGGVAAIADGASTGIYCSIWADQLSKRFLTDRPDTRDPVFLNKWVNGLRSEWRTAIKYGSLNWSKQAKVDQTGAAATLLTLETGPADATGARPWRACAVGDASLFQVRSGRLVATFPVVAADQFGSAPLLVRSNPGFKTLALAAAGTCRPGDRFLLATDAVAARLFRDAAAGPEPDWGRYEHLSQDAWRAELDALRRANDMVNDDCTLVVLRVAGAGEEPDEVIPDALPIEEDGRAGEGEGRAGGVSPLFEMQEPKPLAESHDEDAAEQNTEQGADAPRSPENAVGDLMLDVPHDPPADEPPAARDGFPESTDPRD